MNGAPFGQVRADGTLLDADGETVGEAKRPGGLPAIFQVGSVAVRRDARERSYPLILHGTTVARVAHPPIEMFNAIELKKRAIPPAVEIVDLNPAHAAEWTLALSLLQVAYHLFESVWTN